MAEQINEDVLYCLMHGHNPTDGDLRYCVRCGRDLKAVGFKADDVCRGRITAAVEAVIDAIEETFLAQLPSKALSYCAQEDVNAGLDALRERFGVGNR